MKMIKVYFNGALESGSYIQDAMVEVSEDYTMTEITTAIKEAGYIGFMLPTMRRMVYLGK